MKLVPIGDDQLPASVEKAVPTGRLPDVVQLPMASAHTYAQRGLLDTDSAQEVVDALGEDTFSARALSLLTSEGNVTAVPSDGWGQLLIYRKDLFDRAGLPAPRTLDDVRRAARRLKRPGMAGIVLGTGMDPFTAESFEHVALAEGCRLVDDRGRVALRSPACRGAFAAYVELARNASVKGAQTVESTRDAYFAGRAAMIFWSPFLLDAMAGLRNDAVPSCPQCRADPAYLARNSGLIGPLSGANGGVAQFADITTWGITAQGDRETAKRLVEYLMSDGYERWLALSPQGKYPVRFGTRGDSERYVKAWSELLSGVERKAPLRRFYSRESIDSLGAGVRNFQRWGFEQGQAALVGAMRGPEPIPQALAQAIAGRTDPEGAARRAQKSVETLQAATE